MNIKITNILLIILISVVASVSSLFVMDKFFFHKLELEDGGKILIMRDSHESLKNDGKKFSNQGSSHLTTIDIIKSKKGQIDEISIANDLGRLDLISIMLGILALILGFGAIIGFLYIKESSQIIAKDVANQASMDWLEKNASKVFKDTTSQHSDKIRMDKDLRVNSDLNEVPNTVIDTLDWEDPK